MMGPDVFPLAALISIAAAASPLYTRAKMHTSDWVSIGAAVLAFLEVVLSINTAFRTSRKTGFINTVTAARVKHMAEFRGNIAEFMATIQLCKGSANLGQALNASNRLVVLRYTIFLQLNWKDTLDNALRELVLTIDPWSNNPPYQELSNLTEEYLRREWEHIKREAEMGRLDRKSWHARFVGWAKQKIDEADALNPGWFFVPPWFPS
jgi:hypothetical protein